MKYEKGIQALDYMQQIYADMFTATNKIQILGDKHLAELTLRQFMAVLAVMHLPQEMTTFNNIAKKLGTTKQNVSTMISGLEKKGFVRTVPCPHDKRSMNVMVTESGLKTMEQCGISGVLFLEEIFHDFALEELAVMGKLLKKLLYVLSDDVTGFEDQIGAPPENDSFSDEQMMLLEEFVRRRNE